MGKLTGFKEFDRKNLRRRSVSERIQDWKEIYFPWNEKEAKEQGKKVVKRVKKRVKSAWQKFLKDFKFRKQKRNESNAAYFGARTKAASRAYKRLKKK